MLMPSEEVITDVLSKYRLLERGMFRDPSDPEIRARFHDTAYTLCVLMGRRTPLEAVRVAESRLAVLRDRKKSPDSDTMAAG
ncbi:uncharacterized protein DUF5133 [Streptomyces sp. SLBN-118]|uniref:DUF5133 domain-containing protein n=1 Tax=Streptomyces sp. SLBN-118 TaxID=2768454 RepID=UPI001150C869|nr:DUF5133 domain-containing protein [Streptomyces sp. SLBN-118]TQK42381.1 uncharacterized protein DUF5133 [Streptomyces sp. SLBN-118]